MFRLGIIQSSKPSGPNEYVSLACEINLGPSNGDVEIVNVTDNNTLLQTFT